MQTTRQTAWPMEPNTDAGLDCKAAGISEPHARDPTEGAVNLPPIETNTRRAGLA